MARYLPYSPRNGNEFAEGNWKDWLELARKIIAHDHDDRQSG